MSNYQIGVEVDVYLNDIAYQIARSTPKHVAREFILLLDAEYADKDFTEQLVASLVDVLNDEYDMNLSIINSTDTEDEE